jgi:hypothetical protein
MLSSAELCIHTEKIDDGNLRLQSRQNSVSFEQHRGRRLFWHSAKTAINMIEQLIKRASQPQLFHIIDDQY